MANREEWEVVVDSTKAKKGAKEAEESLTKSFLKAEVAIRVTEKALDAVTASIRKSIEAAVENERTTAALQAALRNQGLEIERNTEVLNRQSAALERLTGMSDESIRGVQALAINMGVGVDQVEDFTRAAIILANTGNMTVDGAMQQLVKTTGGLKGELGETIPAIRDLTEEELRAGEAVRVINEQLGENLGLMNEGLSGTWNRATLALESLGEALVLDLSKGAALNEVLESVATALESVGDIVTKYGSVQGFLALLDIAFTGGDNIAEQALVDPGSFEDAVAERARKVTESGLSRLDAMDPKPAGKGRGEGKGKGARGEKFSGTLVDADDQSLAGAVGADSELFEATFVDADDQMIEFERRKAEIILSLEQEIADGKVEIRERNVERLIEISNKEIEAEEKAARERERIIMRSFNTAAGIVEGFAAAAIDAFIAWANGADVAFDQVVKGFLESTGQQLIGQGIKDVLVGTSRLILGDQTGTLLMAHGGVEIASGAAMIGGSLIIPAGQGSTAASGAAGGTGGAGGSAGAVNTDQEITQTQRTININVFGKPTAELGRFIQDAEREASIRGVG